MQRYKFSFDCSALLLKKGGETGRRQILVLVYIINPLSVSPLARERELVFPGKYVVENPLCFIQSGFFRQSPEVFGNR